MKKPGMPGFFAFAQSSERVLHFAAGVRSEIRTFGTSNVRMSDLTPAFAGQARFDALSIGALRAGDDCGQRRKAGVGSDIRTFQKTKYPNIRPDPSRTSV
jgi:hypothetical protein